MKMMRELMLENQRLKAQLKRQERSSRRRSSSGTPSSSDDNDLNVPTERVKRTKRTLRAPEMPELQDEDGSSEEEDDDDLYSGRFFKERNPYAVNDSADLQRRLIELQRLPAVRRQLTVDQVVELFGKPVSWNGSDLTLGHLCNFHAQDVLHAFLHRGVTFACAMEQSQKSFLLVALAALASMTKRPCMLVVGLQLSSCKDLFHKMKSTLLDLGIRSTFLSNAETDWRKIKSNHADVNDFLRGSHLLITPSYAMARSTVIEELDARDVLVMMDESDAAFTKDAWPEGSKEAEFARLVGNPQDPESRVSSVVLVSATHVADYHTWNTKMPNVPKAFITVDLEVLRQRGFTTHAEMDLIGTVTQDEGNKKTQYGLRTQAFRTMMQDFVTCPGTKKLMIVASCPYVKAGESNLFTQASEVLDLDPEAVVLLHNSGHCWFVVRKRGSPLREHEVEHEMKINTPKANGDGVKEMPVKFVSLAFDLLRERFCRGPNGEYVDKRFVIVGYNALSRSTSTRTADMVPTHIFVLMGKGRNSADTRQTLMRPAGKTTTVRHANGHGNVKVVTIAEDWDLVRALYGFQEFIGEETQKNPRFDFESYDGYSVRAEPVINSVRRHTRPQMPMKGTWKFQATPEEIAALKQERHARKRAIEQIQAHINRANDEVENEGDEDRNMEEFVVPDTTPVQSDDRYITVGEDLPLERRDAGGASTSRGSVNDAIMRLLRGIEEVGGSVRKSELSSLAVSVGVNLKTGHRKITNTMRRYGWITHKDVDPVSITRKGREKMLQLE